MTNENKRTINNAINDIITSRLKEIPTPTQCTITHTYPDQHADIHTATFGDISYVELLAPCTVGDTGVLLFLDGSLDNRIIIPNLFNIINNLNDRIDELEPTKEEE